MEYEQDERVDQRVKETHPDESLVDTRVDRNAVRDQRTQDQVEYLAKEAREYNHAQTPYGLDISIRSLETGRGRVTATLGDRIFWRFFHQGHDDDNVERYQKYARQKKAKQSENKLARRLYVEISSDEVIISCKHMNQIKK